jgi:putative transposase
VVLEYDVGSWWGYFRMTFQRANIRLHAARYIGRITCFVTMCCAGRKPILENCEIATRLTEILAKHAQTHKFAVHAYCVMPDHFHFLAAGLSEESDLLAFVKNVKQTSSAEYEKRFHGPLWQKKFYDRILRETDNFHGAAGYIWMNPVRKGLCQDPREYPYSGSFVCDWKSAITPVESWIPEWKKN